MLPKSVVWWHGKIGTPPFSTDARRRAGLLLRQLQLGADVSMPESRPLPSIGRGVHELRVRDGDRSWRVIYRIEPDAVVVLDVFAKTTRTTPKRVLDRCRDRLARYQAATK